MTNHDDTALVEAYRTMIAAIKAAEIADKLRWEAVLKYSRLLKASGDRG